MAVPPDPMTFGQAGRYVGVSRVLLRRLIDEDEIPAVRDGRTYRIAQADLDAYIERHRMQPGSIPYA